MNWVMNHPPESATLKFGLPRNIDQNICSVGSSLGTKRVAVISGASGVLLRGKTATTVSTSPS